MRKSIDYCKNCGKKFWELRNSDDCKCSFQDSDYTSVPVGIVFIHHEYELPLSVHFCVKQRKPLIIRILTHMRSGLCKILQPYIYL